MKGCLHFYLLVGGAESVEWRAFERVPVPCLGALCERSGRTTAVR